MIIEKWIRVLIEPKLTFAEEELNASLLEAIKMVFIAGVIVGIFGILAKYISLPTIDILFPSSYIHLPYDEFFGRPLSLHEYLAVSFVSNIIFFPFIFLIFSGILFLLAKLFKGEGNITTQTYLIALFYAPCTIIASALNVIPSLGWFLALLVFIYGLYLLTLALKETHQYSTENAILTWSIPLIIFILFILLIIIAIIILFITLVSLGIIFYLLKKILS